MNQNQELQELQEFRSCRIGERRSLPPGSELEG
jgi:hypothetical protein